MKQICILVFVITKLFSKIKQTFLRFWWQAYGIGNLYYAKANFSTIYFNGRCVTNLRGKVNFGKDIIINSSPFYCIDNDCCSKIIVSKDANLSIGDFSGISNTVIYTKQSITIGNHVNIGAGCLIIDSNFHSTDWNLRFDRTKDVQNAKNAPIEIKDLAFIGARSIICKGVTIGEHSIIAAGSVVACSVPDNELWGGVPAKFIKKSQL